MIRAGRHAAYMTCQPESLRGGATASPDLPCRVMRDVYRERSGRLTGRCSLGNALEWLPPGDARVLPGAAGDDMSATVHVRLRLVEVAGVEGREHNVTVAVRQCASAVNVLLAAGVDAHSCAFRFHLVEHLLAFHVLGGLLVDRIVRSHNSYQPREGDESMQRIIVA